MKQVVAPALLVLALAAVTPASATDTVVRDCHGCNAPMRSYGSGQLAQLRPEAEQTDAQAADRSYQPAPEPSYAPPPQRSYAPPPERSYAPPPRRSYAPPPPRAYRPEVVRSYRECRDCDAPRKNYDSVEVVKTRRNIDRSRVIHTKTIMPVYRRVRPVVQVPVVTVVQYVVHRYYVVDKPLTYSYQMPAYQPAYRVHRRAHPVYHRSRVLRVGG